MRKAKQKKRYTTLYIPGDMEISFASCNNSLQKCDCNLSQMVCILVPLIIKVCVVIFKMSKNFRHFRFELIARDHGTGLWISSDETIEVRQKD